MLLTESGPTFVIVTVVMVGIVSSLPEKIPICEPPAPTCSLFQRTVCEWSDAGEPVWTCQGLFGSATVGAPKLSSNGMDDAQDSDPDVVLGTYEYQLPQVNLTKGSSKQESEDSEETDVKYVTFTYPIATKVKKNSASQVESKSEFKFESSGNTSSTSSSSVSKSESASKISSGTNTNSSVGKKESNVETIKPFAENLVASARANHAVSKGSGSDINSVAEVLTSKNSSAVQEESASIVKTKTSSSSARNVHEAHTHVQMETIKYEALAENSKSALREESVSGSKNIETGSESSLLGAHDYQISSDKQTSNSQKENHSSIQSVAVSALNDTSSAAIVQADTLISSSEGATSRSNSEDDLQFVTHQVSSREMSSAKRHDHQAVTSDSTSPASTGVRALEEAFTEANPGTSDHRRQDSETADRSVVCETNQEQRVQTNQATSVHGLQSSSMFDETRRSLATKNLDAQTKWGYLQNAGYDSALANQQYNSWMNKYAWAYRNPGVQDFAGNAEYVRNGQWNLGRFYESPGVSSNNENRGFSTNGDFSADYLNTATDYNTARYYQQYESNSAGGSGMAPQFGDSVAPNYRFPFSYPYYGYHGYQSSQQYYPALSTPLATSGNGYPWPQLWGPQPNSAAYGSQWMGLNTLVASQSDSPSISSGLCGLQNLNPGSENFAFPTSNSAEIALPYAQHVIPSLCPCYEFCKMLMSIFGGTSICDALQPIILECYSKILEVIWNRLN